MRKKSIDETRKRKQVKMLLAQLEGPFRILTDERTLEEQRRLFLQALRDGEMSRWAVAVQLTQSLIIREIQWWIDQSELPRSEDDRRQHANVFYALTQLAKLLPAGGDDLRRAAAEVEN